MRGLEKVDMKRGQMYRQIYRQIYIYTLQLLERIGLRADSLKRLENCMIGTKVKHYKLMITNRLILPFGGVSIGRVCHQ